MSSIFELLSQQSPNVRTRKALILLGLQNDFLSSQGKLPVRSTAFVDQLRELVPAFRQYGDVIWVRTEGDLHQSPSAPDEHDDSVIVERPAAESRRHDDELFLNPCAGQPPSCLKGTSGAAFATQVQDLIHTRDMKIIKSHYSAFTSTTLLLTLRSKLVTELYLCGCLTNLSVYATAVDAARYGIKINLVEDCLGYRTKARHDLAIKHLRDYMDADSMKSDQVITHLRNPPPLDACGSDEDGADSDEDDGPFTHSADHRSSNSSNAIDDLLAAESDHSDDDMVLPKLSALSMRDQERDARCPRPLSSRSMPAGGAREYSASSSSSSSSSRRSQASSASGPRVFTPRHGERGTEERRRRDVAGHSPAAGETNQTSLPSPRTSPTGKSPTGSPNGHVNVVPSKRHLESSIEPSDSLSRSAPATMAAPLTGIDASPVDTNGAEGNRKKRPSPRRASPAATPWSRASARPLFGEDRRVESAGSRMLYDFLPVDSAATVFQRITDEVSWQRMHHQTGEVPRLVCCQGTVDGGAVPVYRHPCDQTLALRPWTLTVDHVRQLAEKVVGHPLNHALIQLYRDGSDCISEHSDKTLDMVAGSSIVNVSFGAQRTMRLRSKRSSAARMTTGPESTARTTYRIPMPHNSLIAMSPITNAHFLHGINPDKRRAVERSAAERAFGGQRVSLTFRHIGTFLTPDARLIWGQGAVGKTRAEARPVVNGDASLSERLVRAFGAENQASCVPWRELYGAGSNVLHLKEG